MGIRNSLARTLWVVASRPHLYAFLLLGIAISVDSAIVVVSDRLKTDFLVMYCGIVVAILAVAAFGDHEIAQENILDIAKFVHGRIPGRHPAKEVDAIFEEANNVARNTILRVAFGTSTIGVCAVVGRLALIWSMLSQ